MALSARGVRVIAVDAPAYWSVEEWCRGFKQLLTQLSVEKVHIFGAALGGFLAQKFAEFTRPCPRVASLILCNSFTDTTVFKVGGRAAVGRYHVVQENWICLWCVSMPQQSVESFHELHAAPP